MHHLVRADKCGTYFSLTEMTQLSAHHTFTN